MEGADYYRARQEFIYKLMNRSELVRNEKNNHLVLLRNGVIPSKLLNGSTEKRAVKQLLTSGNYITNPLAFEELTILNTWFNMHPEKVAGVEKVTTSIQFPITIVGDEKLIKETLKRGLKSGTVMPGKNTNKRIRLAEAEAEAIMIMLELEN